MRRSGSRVLAGIASLAIGGVFVAASAMGALADSPSPSSLVATVNGNSVSVSGTIAWGAGCKKGAGYGVVWNDTGDVGLPAPGDASKLVGLTGKPGGETDNNLVHPAACGAGGITFGPLAHTYVGQLPSEVCVIGYHYVDGQTNKAFHSVYQGDAPGQPGNTDNSILEPAKGGQAIICQQIVKKQPDVTITNVGSPSATTPGDLITYKIVVSNLAAASGTTTQTQLLTDTLDNNTTFVSVVGSGSWTNCVGAGHTVTCKYTPLLNPGDKTSEVTVVAKVDDKGQTSVDNVAHVDNGVGNPDDANVNNQTATVTTPVSTPQDITVHKTATPKVNVGELITYTVDVTNTSSASTKSPITVTDPLPAEVDYQSASGTNWSCSGGQNLTCAWNGGSLAPGASTTKITITAIALEAAVPSVTNTAKAHMGNLTVQDKATTIVNTPVNLTLHKSADPPSGSDVEPGDQIDYTLHYANTGTVDADDVTITDEVPTGTSYVAGSADCTTTCTAGINGNTVTWTLDIPANSSGDATFSVKVDSDAFDGEVIDNIAYITFKGHKVPSNRTKHLVIVPTGDLRLHKAVTPTSATIGTVLTYTLNAKATGDIDQTDVVVTDVIPDGTTYQAGSATCSTGCASDFDAASKVVSWSVGDMSPGDLVTMTFKVKVNGADANGTVPTEIDNIGHIKSNETPKKPSNRVVVPVTVVLGERIVNTPPPTTLPFTGFDTLQNALLALVLIGAGLVILTWPRLQPQYREAL